MSPAAATLGPLASPRPRIVARPGAPLELNLLAISHCPLDLALAPLHSHRIRLLPRVACLEPSQTRLLLATELLEAPPLSCFDLELPPLERAAELVNLHPTMAVQLEVEHVVRIQDQRTISSLLTLHATSTSKLFLVSCTRSLRLGMPPTSKLVLISLGTPYPIFSVTLVGTNVPSQLHFPPPQFVSANTILPQPALRGPSFQLSSSAHASLPDTLRIVLSW